MGRWAKSHQSIKEEEISKGLKLTVGTFDATPLLCVMKKRSKMKSPVLKRVANF
jgi:hypothetical protein